MIEKKREIEWAGDSRDVIRGFPDDVKWTLGRAIFKAETGERHEKVSAMKGRLRGIVEVGEEHDGDAYRLYYTLKCPDFIYILYCHKKKSKRGISIPKHEEDVIIRRFKDSMIHCQKSKEEVG
ncbi:MAG TPA: type II toxin-antitoxin system RelE/ParE family toxin [Longimicrobiaceae bacterium]|nr:type II toxin-antitoxin system RelE/ParE family toxin [Longimicrobiaceae bacterium]